MNWIRQLQSSFGTPFLLLICLIYWTQGFRSFAWTAVSYQLKDELKLSPSASQFLVSIAFFPWSIKPLYGILSDCVPIQGRKRLPYLIIASILSLVPWLFLGLIKSLRNSYAFLTILLTFQNLGSAMADVVIDAMVAEAARQERATYAGDLQSLSWLAMAIGGIAGSLIGGYALSNFRIQMIYLLFSIFPTIQLFACSLVEEKSSSSFRTVEQVNEQEPPDMPKSGLEKPDEKDDGGESESSPQVSADDLEEQVIQNDDEWVKIQKKNSGEIVEESYERMQDDTSMKEEISVSEDKPSLLDIYKVDGMRRRKKPHGIEREKKISEAESKRVDHKDYREKQWLLNVKSTYSTLIQAMRQPIILRPMLWFFLAQVAIPNISTVMFYYQTDVLHLDASFLGSARVIGWGGLMLGTFIYNHYLKCVPLRNIFLGTHISLSFLTFLDVILVSHINVSFGISDKAFVLCTSALADAVNQFKLMPFLVLSGRLCPPGIEGTLFALFMSINNFGGTVSSFFGAVLASALHISSERFDNLALGIYVQAVCTLIPVCFLFLIPKKATGSSSQE